MKSFFFAYNPQGIIKTEEKRLRYIDVAYLIGVILVVFGHSHPISDAWWGTWCSDFIGFIYSFHMQFYFFIAGYLLIHSHSIDKLGYKKWAFKKLLKFGIPYVLLSIIAYYPKSLIGNTSDIVELNPIYFLRNTFLVPREGVWGHFWFITAFITIDLLWGIWRAYAPKNVHVYRFGLILGGIISVILVFFPFRTDWFTLQDISFVAIFYFLGIVIALAKPSTWNTITKNLLAIIPCAVLVYLLYPYGNFTNFTFTETPEINFLVALGMVWICWSLAHVISKISKSKLPAIMSDMNYTIFLYSWPAQATLEAFIRNMQFSLVLKVLALFILGFTFPIILTVCYKKFPFFC